MNVRIKELAEQAKGTKTPGFPVWQFYNTELEKFAELIVGECARCVEHINMQGGGNLGDVIKNKFGVKE